MRFFFTLYCRHFEKYLVNSGKELNVIVNPMNPVINCFINRHWRLNDIQREITHILNKANGVVELVVVIIPDYPTNVYGKD